MSATESYIKTTLDRIRLYMDEVSDNAKYSDTVLLRDVISPAIADVMHRVNNSSQLPVVCVYDITLPAGETSFTLPPCIGQLWGVRTVDADGNDANELIMRHDLSVGGYSYRVEGNTLQLSAEMTIALDIRLLYIHNGKAGWHYGGTAKEGTASTTTGVSKLVANLTPTTGIVDRRMNAYGGQVLRTFPATGIIEERVISAYAYSSAQWELTLRDAFTVVDGSIEYEIVPPGPDTMWEAVLFNSCIKLGTIRNSTNKKMQMLADLNRAAMKTCLEQAGNFDGRGGKKFAGSTRDTNSYSVWQ